MDVDSVQNGEDYILMRARNELKSNPTAAKAWMITAKTLYPNNFGVQYEAYKIEKAAGNVKEAARCFTDLVGRFQQQPEFWEEINALTLALRTEHEVEGNKQFLCEMFKHISAEVQHKLLLITADHCEDTQEHCKLLLLLLQKFPSSVKSHGTGLIETLLSAEKHNLSGSQPVNKYRQLLLCDLAPMLYSNGSKLELAPKLVFKLLHKAIEYYLHILWGYICNPQDDVKQNAESSWQSVYKIFEFACQQLSWDASLTTLRQNWCKETHWAKMVAFSKLQNLEDVQMSKQLAYGLALFLLYCLYQYLFILNADNVSGQKHPSYLLVQGFPHYCATSSSIEPEAKRRRSSESSTGRERTSILLEKRTPKQIVASFTMAVNCWDLLLAKDNLNREFLKLSAVLSLEPWLSTFLVDYLIYKDQHDDALHRLENDSHYPLLPKLILRAEIYFLQRNYITSYDNVREALQLLPAALGDICENITIASNQRHLLFLPLTRLALVQYLSKFILRAIRANGFKTDMSVGHCFVLMQADWPIEHEFLPALIQEICKTRTFYYLPFPTYIVDIDILEELAYIWNSQNGQITYEILPNMHTRRIGTRGADKGIREEIKLAIKRQIDTPQEPVHELVQKFLLQERTHISLSLL